MVISNHNKERQGRLYIVILMLYMGGEPRILAPPSPPHRWLLVIIARRRETGENIAIIKLYMIQEPRILGPNRW